jgi:hypothetical protein
LACSSPIVCPSSKGIITTVTLVGPNGVLVSPSNRASVAESPPLGNDNPRWRSQT